jgi:predicted transcriptional regulator
MDIVDLMKTFSSSRRMEVLESLLRGETRDEIKERVPTSTFAFTLDYLKKEGFAEVVAGEVVVTDRGRAYLLIFDQFRKSVSTLETLYATFFDHMIYFPDEFLPRLYEIADSEIVASEPSNVLKPHRVFFENISKSREIMGVAPLLFPDYPEFFSALTSQIDRISLVVTREIYDIVSGYPAIRNESVEIHVIDENPKIAFTVTDCFLSIGFFYRSGNYDFTRDLVSTSPEAICFGRDLFDYYVNKARKMEKPA